MLSLQIVGLKRWRCFNFSYYVSRLLTIVASLFPNKDLRVCHSYLTDGAAAERLWFRGPARFQSDREKKVKVLGHTIPIGNHSLLQPNTVNLSSTGLTDPPLFPEPHQRSSKDEVRGRPDAEPHCRRHLQFLCLENESLLPLNHFHLSSARCLKFFSVAHFETLKMIFHGGALTGKRSAYLPFQLTYPPSAG